MLSQEVIQKILGIKESVYVSPEEMARQITIAFYPTVEPETSDIVKKFSKDIEKDLKDIGVKIIPYEQALESYPLHKILKRLFFVLVNNISHTSKKFLGIPTETIFFGPEAVRQILERKRIRRGVSLIVTGEQKDRLPMERIYSFKHNSIITILDFPALIDEKTPFLKHFDTAMDLFSKNMTNIVIGVSAKKWILYNFNASHPTYDMHEDKKPHLLKGLIPKIAAPIRPYTISEFEVKKDKFSPLDPEHKEATDDLVLGAKDFAATNLYPPGKKISDLPFRNSYHQYIGKLHLDHRNGMSFGFMAHTTPTKLGKVYALNQDRTAVELVYGDTIPSEHLELITNALKGKSEKDFFSLEHQLHILLRVKGENYAIEVPPIHVLSQRSGSDKTNVKPTVDLLKLGLEHGRMTLQIANDARMSADYKPSFDTQVILAHTVGSAMIAALIRAMKNSQRGGSELGNYDEWVEKTGLGIAHWHGYINSSHVPPEIVVHGRHNPHVSCSSPQSAIYALGGKLESAITQIEAGKTYAGDIHIEPHHGSNATFQSLEELVKFITRYPDTTALGNLYLGVK